MSCTILRADAARLPLADQCVDLVFGSPPYCDARTYGIDAQRGCVEWVEWMLVVTTEAQRVCRGPVVWVAAGVTRERNYWPACEGLLWEWWRRGRDCQLYRPCTYHRHGIAGSGGTDWFRADTEYVMCFKRPGELPWSDNTAMGHPPKWGPGGAMSHRLSNGQRRNRDQWGGNLAGLGTRRANGERQTKCRPSHRPQSEMEVQSYRPPKLANPGNVIKCKVGGGRMGDSICHENEAPFPERLAEWFIRSLCPPGGTVLDPFSGSGTTAKVALSLDRNAIASDLRASECAKTKRRTAQVQRLLA